MKRKKNNRWVLVNGPVPAATGISGIQPYNFVETDENSVEVEMYGQVVENRPVDWWTGKPVDGLYIVLAEFLNDLDKYREKDNITFRINSVGGDLYAGISICNRISELKGNTVTIVDGLAASAASIILQGGKTRKIFAGSQVMVHGVSVFLYGSYNAADMEKMAKRVEAGNVAAIETYAKRTGKEKQSIKDMMEREEWMTGQKAIDNGFADELMSEEKEVNLSVTEDHRFILSNGILMPASGFGNLPVNLPVKGIASGFHKNPAVIDKKTTKTGGKTMTLEELKKNHPELIEQIENDARQGFRAETDAETMRAEAVRKERERLKEIEQIENQIPDKTLVNSAKYGENTMTAQELAFEAMKKNREAGNEFLENLMDDAGTSGVEAVAPAPNAGQKNKTEMEAEETANMAKMIAGTQEEE